jgi:hypothetical protein
LYYKNSDLIAMNGNHNPFASTTARENVMATVHASQLPHAHPFHDFQAGVFLGSSMLRPRHTPLAAAA